MSQPVNEAYPNAVIRKLDFPHRNGNYAPAFIVVAVIVVLAVLACAVSRLCNRQDHRVKEADDHVDEENHHDKAVNHHAEVKPTVEHADKPSPSLGPREWESMQRPNFNLYERAYLELGYGMRIPSAGMANNGGGMVLPPHYNGGGMVQPPPPHYNGGGVLPPPPHYNGEGMLPPPPHYNDGGMVPPPPQVRFADNV